MPAWMLVLKIPSPKVTSTFRSAWDFQTVGHSVLELGESQGNQEGLVTLIIAGGFIKL